VGQFTIGTLAKQAGTNVETVRYYQSRGLVDEPRRPPGGVRRYTQAHVRRLRFIKQAQTLGFSLDEVIELLALEDGENCLQAEQMGAKKLEIVRERIAQLRQVERALATLVDQCHCNTGKVHCPLIASLESGMS
jgi:MerR family mercuric resistance operon transcriptional regulator